MTNFIFTATACNEHKHLNLKSESDNRKIHETCLVPFMDANHMAAAGFYFTNLSDIFR